MLLTIIALLLILVYFLKWWKQLFTYWERKNVPHIKPTSYLDHYGIKKTKHVSQLCEECYNSYASSRYVGIYVFNDPVLVIKDYELIKQITVKDFDHFTDHWVFIHEDADPLWGKNLFALTGNKWRRLRPTLSPSFTSSKMKYMFNIMAECSKSFADFFLNRDENLIELEMKEVFTRYTNDVIASSAFGLKCNSLIEPDNTFYTNGLVLSKFNVSLRFLIHMAFPKLAKFLRIKVFPLNVNNYFKTIIRTTIEKRKEQNVVRPDMLQLLIQAKSENNESKTLEKDESVKSTNASLTMEDIYAQAFIFFFAGFETVSNSVCFIAYELAVNPNIQEKLIKEIDESTARCSGNINYEVLLKMSYLDNVISESLRKWTPAPFTDRLVTKTYTIKPEKPNEPTLILEKGDKIWIPLHGIQHDPKYFPDPDKFIPERFSDKNKASLTPFTFLPFGIGPRNCIGSRFALLEIKLLIYHILLNFQIVPTQKSQIPVVLDAFKFSPCAQDGMHLGFQKRNKSKLK